MIKQFFKELSIIYPSKKTCFKKKIISKNNNILNIYIY